MPELFQEWFILVIPKLAFSDNFCACLMTQLLTTLAIVQVGKYVRSYKEAVPTQLRLKRAKGSETCPF